MSSAVVTPVSSGASRSASSVPTQTGTQPSPGASTLVVGEKQVGSWPAGVTLPYNTTIVTATADTRGGSVTVSPDSKAGLIGHLRGDLRRVGMTTDIDTGDGFSFRGPGWRGQVVTEGAYVTVTWSLGDWVPDRHPDEVGLAAGVPVSLTYPPGAIAAQAKVQSGGSSYDLIGRSPADLLSYYRTHLWPSFTVTSDRAEDGVTTVTFSDREYDSVITASGTTFRMVHTKRR